MKTWNLAYFVDQQYIVTVQASEHCGVTFILTHFILCILILSFPVVVLPLFTTSTPLVCTGS